MRCTSHASAAALLQAGEFAPIAAALLAAYRWQYIVSGVQDKRFGDLLASLITPAQAERVQTALQPLLA